MNKQEKDLKLAIGLVETWAQKQNSKNAIDPKTKEYMAEAIAAYGVLESCWGKYHLSLKTEAL